MAKQCAEHRNEMPCRECGNAAMDAIISPATRAAMDRNARVQARYDELMQIGKHGHYETMFQVVREEVERATSTPN